MTLSPRPWHLKQVPGSLIATLHDATGNCIGQFINWQDGEYLLSDPIELVRLKEENEKLQDKVADLEEEIRLSGE